MCVIFVPTAAGSRVSDSSGSPHHVQERLLSLCTQ